jgi:hypothetical protein
VIWAEFGRSVQQAAATQAEALELQRRLYENLYRMVVESGADGSVCWWWPGGYRVDEDSDYGIIAPDGAPRPAALELARFASEITGPRPLAKPDGWITIDRDASARGYAAVWEKARDRYAEEIDRGLRLAVRTEATDATTETVPKVGLGGTTWRPGLPWKWLSGEIHGIRVGPEGRPVGLTSGAAGELRVPAGEAVALSVEVVNTSEVLWLAGSVAIKGYVEGREVFAAAITEPLARYGRARVTIPETRLPEHGRLTLRLTCDGQPFGTPVKLELGAAG